MKNFVGYLLVLMLGIGIGTGLSSAMADDVKPAYVIVSGSLLDPEGMGPYAEKAGPLARAAGISVMARGEVEVLEGTWSHPQAITVERFDSMDALRAFWYSDGYQEAKKLRDGKFKADFIVAVEGS